MRPHAAQLRRFVLRALTLGSALGVVALLLLFLFLTPLMRLALAPLTRDLDGRLVFERARLSLNGVALDDLRVESRQDGLVLEAASMQAGLHPLAYLSSGDAAALVGDISVQRPVLTLRVDPEGVLNLSRLFRARPPGRPWLARYRGRIHVVDGTTFYRDERRNLFVYQAGFDGFLRTAGSDPMAALELTLRPVQQRPGELKLTGGVGRESPVLDLRLLVQNLELKPFSGFPSLQGLATLPGGQLEGDLQAAGRAPSFAALPRALSWSGSLRLKDGALSANALPWPIEQLNGQASLAGNALHLDSFRGQADGTPFQVRGDVFLPPRLWLDLQADFPRIQAHRLRQLSPRAPKLQGEARLELSLEGSTESPELRGTVRSAHLASGEQELHDLDLSFRLSERLLEVEQASARAAGGQLWGSGFVFLDQEALLLDLGGDRASLQELSPDLSGQASFQASVLGTLAEPMVQGSAEVLAFQGLGQALDSARTHFFYGADTLLLRSATLARGGTEVRVPGAYLDFKDSYLAAGVEAEQVAFPPLTIRGRTLTGSLSGKGMLWGLWEKPSALTARGNLRGSRLAMSGHELSELAGAFLLSGGRLYFPGLTGRIEQGQVEAAGSYGLKGQDTRLALHGTDLPGRILHDLLALPVTFTSPIQARLLYVDTGPDWFDAVAGNHEGRVATEGVRRQDDSLEAMVWADQVDLRVLGMPAFHRVAEEFTGLVGLEGPARSFSFIASGELAGPQLGLTGPVELNTWGQRQGTVLKLDQGYLAWDYPPTRSVATTGVHGQAYPFPGPIFAPPLHKTNLGEFSTPTWGLLSLRGTIDLAARQVDLRYKAQDIELGWLASRPWLDRGRNLNQALDHHVAAGVGEATGTVRGSFAMPTVAGQVDLPWMALEGGQVYSARGRLSGNRRQMAFEPLWVSAHPFDSRLGQGPGEDLMEVRGRVAFDARKPSQLTFSTRGFDAPRAVALLPERFSTPFGRLYGQVSFDRLRLTGPLARPALAGRLQMRRGGLPFQDRIFPLDNLLVDFKSKAGEFAISRLELESGQLRMLGSGNRNASGDYVAQLYSHDVPMSYFHGLGAPFTALSGNADLALRLQTRAGQPVAYLGLESDQLAWSPSALTGLPAASMLLGQVRLGGLQRNPDGTLSTGSGQGLELAWSGTRATLDIPPDSLSFLTEGASLSAQGSVSFQPPRPDDRLSDWFKSPAGPDFGPLRTGPFQARMENFTMSQLAGLLGLTTDLEGRMSGTVSLEGQWYRDLETLGVTRLPQYGFEVRSLELARQLEERRLALSLDGPATLSFGREGQNALLSLSPTRLKANGGFLEAMGQLVLAGNKDSSLTATVRDMPLESLAWLYPTAAAVRGHVEQLDLKLQGLLPTPELNISFRAVRESELVKGVELSLAGQVSGRPQSNGSYLVDFGSPGVILTIGSAVRAAEHLTLGGQIPLRWVREAANLPDRLNWAWDGLRLRSDGEMNLSAHIEDQNMQLLDTILPQVSQASGKVQGRLDLTGTLELPEVQGGLSIENASLSTSLFPQPITALNVQSRFEQIRPEEAEVVAGGESYQGMFRSRYSIDRFDGLIGGHPFQVTGKAELAGLEPTFLNLGLTGQGIPLQQERFQGTADVALTLEARPGRTRENPNLSLIPVVTGQVDLPAGDLYLQLSDAQKELSSTFRLPLRYDVDLVMGDNFWVHVGDSRVRAQGHLKLQPDSTTRTPVLSGQAFLSRGLLQIPFYNVAFNIRQGWAYWDRSLIPTLENVEADTTIGGYQIMARIDGQYPNLKLDLFSNPPLAQNQLLRMVAVSGLPGGGSEVGSTSIPMNNFLQAQGLAVLSGLIASPITQQISKVLFLSEVSFDYQLPATYVVKLAKALDSYDRVLLTLTRILYGNGLSESLYGLEWRFQPNLLTRVAMDDLGGMRFWFQGIFSWW